MKRLLLTLAILPTPALANFECTAERQCGGGVCEPYPGGPFLVEETGETVRVLADGQTWEGYVTNDGSSDELSIVLPPQNGMSGLITIFPDGAFLFTAHAQGDMAVAITGEGTCVATGG
ncbi:MAG: hypothetical protein LPJ95_11695 [Paracoccaceae bacterium]|nr:hypothetical protein [Paracoccaceae bacterium]